MVIMGGMNEGTVLAGGLALVIVEAMVGMAAMVMAEEEMEENHMTAKTTQQGYMNNLGSISLWRAGSKVETIW